MLINAGNGHWCNPATVETIWVEKPSWFRRLFGGAYEVWVGTDADDFNVEHPTHSAAITEANRIAQAVNAAAQKEEG